MGESISKRLTRFFGRVTGSEEPRQGLFPGGIHGFDPWIPIPSLAKI